ncbi:50S ribosomal protein L11 methyltransferase [Paucidesulfovibrio longus]|uniref:50S ribosomal protein L11 methyltransferase n=1 Tax=Paucidesulfovibrio longus TaxID=889 RepID=UPI00040465A0|nr:50S ribosomal protein L11 methyltransferase [Paucidesulfovibrio longus]
MLYQVQFTVPAEAGKDTAEDLAAFMADRTASGWEEEETPQGLRCRVFFELPSSADKVAEDARTRWPGSEPEVAEQEAENWALAWKDFFVPVSCGERFEVLPPWLKDSGSPEMTPIVIEPKMAFGTGHHATTSLCLSSISDLFGKGEFKDKRFLDLGTGSGILSIGLAMLGLTGRGLDIDPEAVTCAVENAEANKVADKVAYAVGSLDLLAGDERFDVVVANILSGPLIDMAPRLRAAVAPGGRLILSGILGEQAPAVIAAYRAQGLDEPVVRADGEWVALVWTEV